jgi:hypothetical protein
MKKLYTLSISQFSSNLIKTTYLFLLTLKRLVIEIEIIYGGYQSTSYITSMLTRDMHVTLFFFNIIYVFILKL